MGRSSDLKPPLGYPGGPCHVVRRIDREIDNPRVKDRLVNEVEKGKSLSNPEAAKVYDLEVEKGPRGPFHKLLIGPHSQYRMDLRGVQVPAVRGAIQDFLKNLNDWKSRQDWEFDHYSEMISRGEPIEWLDKRTGLFVVFVRQGRSDVKLITTYWKGESDPTGPGLGQCPVTSGYQPPATERSGWRTFVTNPDGTQPGETTTEQYPQRALPSPPWKTEKPTGNWVENVPGDSAQAPDGRTVVDKGRPDPTPGEYSPPANEPARTTPKRRTIEGGLYRPFPSGPERQREQRNPAKRYYQQYYQRHHSDIKKRVDEWHKKWENRSQYKKDKKRRQEYPHRFERKPSRGYRTLAERSRDWRIENKGQPERKEERDIESVEVVSSVVRQRPKKRQRRQKGISRIRSRQYYRKNRQKARMRAKIRYRRNKNKPAFKKQRKIRRKNPQRFRRRRGSVLTAPEIAFVIGGNFDLGYVHSLSPMTGMVTYFSKALGDNILKSMFVSDFLASVGFLEEADAEAMFRLIDAELGLEGYIDITLEGLEGSAILEGIDCFDPKFREDCERLVGKRDLTEMNPYEIASVEGHLVSMYVYDWPGEDEGPHHTRTKSKYDDEMIDSSDDDYIYGTVDLPPTKQEEESGVRVADYYLERKPPESAKPNWHDRATDPLMKDLHHDRTRAEKMNDITEVTDNPGSAKVIPDNTDLMNHKRWPLIHHNQASCKVAVKIPEIMDSCSPEIHRRSEGIPVKLRRVDTRNAQWTFEVTGEAANYQVKFRALKRGRARTPYKMDVLVSCSCPFWQWQGPEYWAKKKGYLLGDPRGTAKKPKIKDPDGVHGACKHVLAVFERVKGFSLPGKKGSQQLAEMLDNGTVFFLFPERKMATRVVNRYLERARRTRDA